MSVEGKIEPIQRFTHTAFDRYPDVFYSVQRIVGSRIGLDDKILSFGCSTGEEVHCLAQKYFPLASIVGLDILPEVLRIASEKNPDSSRIRYGLSTEENLKLFGPFRVIFAMSVLCRYPETDHVEYCGDKFSFAEFERQITLLDAHLLDGGIMVIYNSNFCFLDTLVSQGYDVVLSKHIRINGFVRKFDRFNRAKHDTEACDCVYMKRESKLELKNAASVGLVDIDGYKIGSLSRF